MLCFGLAGFAQEAPKVVKSAFSKKFPTAVVIKWEKLEDATWRVFYKMNKEDYRSVFAEGGNWIHTKYMISIDDIPEKVKSTLNGNYPDHDISEVEVKKTENELVYTIELVNDNRTKFNVIINENGEIVPNTENSEEEEEIEFEEEEEEWD